MKNKKLIGLALASLLVLTGCSSTVQDNGKDVVASIDGQNILADDIYETLSSKTVGKSVLFNLVLNELIEKHFPATNDMKQNADDLINNFKANYQNQYGSDAEEQMLSLLSYYGYQSLDDYRSDIIKTLQISEFIKKYVKDNFDEVYEDYYETESPRFINLIKVSIADVENPTDEETSKLEEVRSLLKTEKSFADIASEYSDDTSKSAKGNLGIIDSTSGLSSTYGSDVEKTALSLKEGEVSEAIQGTDGYYFLYCPSTDKDKIKDELKNIDIDSPLLAYDNYIQILAFNSYDLKYDDENIEKQIKEYVEESLKARDEARGGESS